MPYPIAACRGSRTGRGNNVGMVTLPKDLIVDVGTLLEGFEDATDWTGSGGTFANDTTNVKSGTQSVAFTTDDTARTRDKIVSWDMSAMTKLAFWVYIDDVAKYQNLSIYLSSVTDWSKYFTWFPTAATLVTGWNYLVARLADFTASGGEAWANTIIRIRLRVDAAAGQTVTVSWDDLRMNPTFQPVVMFTWDDALIAQYTLAFPYMRDRNVRATNYVVSSFVGSGGGYLTVANLVSMDAAGWDIANHSATHANFTGLTQEEIETELSTCAAALEGWGLGGAKLHHAYPYGARDADSDAAMAAQGMLTGRLAIDSAGFWMPALNYWHRTPNTNALDSGLSLAAAKTMIDTAVTAQNVCIILAHKLGATADGTTWVTQDFYDLVDYILAANVPIVTMSDLYALKSGPVEVPIPIQV